MENKLLTAEERQAMRVTGTSAAARMLYRLLLRALDSDEARDHRITDLWTVNEALREVLATAERERDEARAVINGLLREYANDDTREAVEACEQCSELVMCSFHSVLSVLAGVHHD